ncbi:murein biosynthesis integral membrane protein MurJ [Peribacillus sp. NPDC096379]|uniref:murein biosynthesis integral membrane protein MurJ n=1 Tax=Peribacillus sp. NPDC096379 TaxID=3364393 RepID=UPI00380B912D
MTSLKKTAVWLTLLAIFLKLSGFLRESIISRQFGAGIDTDAYFAAFGFITLVLAMISGGFNNVFLPLYVKYKKTESQVAEKAANGIMNSTVLIFLVISAFAVWLAPYFVPLIFPNMNPAAEVITIKLSQLFFIFISLIALNGILESYLQGRRIFVPAQISKILATLTGAVFAILFSEQWGIYSLAYGFIVGIILGIFVQFYYLVKSGFSWSPTLKVDVDFRKAFLVLIIPSLLNSVVGQINLQVNRSFAFGTGDGSVTYLNYASLLVSIPNAIYATTIAAIIFTLLSEQVDDMKKFQKTVFMGMEISLVTLMPIAAGLLVVGDAAISFIYEGGKFTAADTQKTYLALVCYLPMIVTQGLQFITSKSMYAQGKTATIFRISVTTIVINFVSNLLIVDRYGYVGLAITSSIVSVYYLAVSSAVVYKDFPKSELRRLVGLFLRVIPPTIIMAAPIWLLKAYTPIHDWYSLFQLALLVPIGAVLYASSLFVFYRQGFNRLLNMLKRKKASA